MSRNNVAFFFYTSPANVDAKTGLRVFEPVTIGQCVALRKNETKRLVLCQKKRYDWTSALTDPDVFDAAAGKLRPRLPPNYMNAYLATRSRKRVTKLAPKSATNGKDARMTKRAAVVCET